MLIVRPGGGQEHLTEESDLSNRRNITTPDTLMDLVRWALLSYQTINPIIALIFLIISIVINIIILMTIIMIPITKIMMIMIPITRNMFPPNIVAATMHQTKIELIYPGENNVSSCW